MVKVHYIYYEFFCVDCLIYRLFLLVWVDFITDGTDFDRCIEDYYSFAENESHSVEVLLRLTKGKKQIFQHVFVQVRGVFWLLLPWFGPQSGP